MDRGTEDFLSKYLKELNENNAAVFVGAGLSKAAGYVDWPGLMSPIAAAIGLDAVKETDLVTLAQFHLNANAGNRHQLNQLLIVRCQHDAGLAPFVTCCLGNYSHDSRAGRPADLGKNSAQICHDPSGTIDAMIARWFMKDSENRRLKIAVINLPMRLLLRGKEIGNTGVEYFSGSADCTAVDIECSSNGMIANPMKMGENGHCAVSVRLPAPV